MSRNATRIVVGAAMAGMAVFFLLGHPVMMDDGFQYEGFAETLARGTLDFRSFYGFQGLSFFAVPIYWLTRSPISIIIASAMFSILSIPLAYAVGKRFGSGPLGPVIFLLTPYPYITLMRGFQEAALFFFILLILYGALEQRWWTPIAWGIGGIIKPFALVLLPLFRIRVVPFLIGLAVLASYGIANYVQTGHFVTLAATGAYHGTFDPAHVPALQKSFALDWKTWARVPANLLIHTRKIMVSPLLLMLGAWSLWQSRRSRWMLAVALNVLLVGAITYAFPKYLLPMTTLLSFAAIPMLIRTPVLVPLVFLDSIAVFVPNYSYFGKLFWSPAAATIPFFLACILWYLSRRSANAQTSSA